MSHSGGEEGTASASLMSRRPVVSVLVGLQAAGKSTFVRTVLSSDAVVVSKDNFPKARRRQARQMRLIGLALTAGHDVVVDNTNPSPDEWTPIIAAARAHRARVVAYFFAPDVEGSYARNAAREGAARVPDVGFYATLAKIRRPTLADGFDEVFTVRLDNAGGFDVHPAEEGG
jgi:predicted kinase